MEQAQLLSDEAYNLAEQHQLGKPISEFPNLIEAENLRKGRKNIRIGMFLSWLFVTVLFIGLAVLTYFITQQTDSTPSGSSANLMKTGCLLTHHRGEGRIEVVSETDQKWSKLPKILLMTSFPLVIRCAEEPQLPLQ